ncbi:MAG: HupE/UreJ family protein [Gemmatimonadales bacterium]
MTSASTRRPRRLRPAGAAACAAALILAFPSTPEAHEIPARVAVVAFVKPEGHRLRLVMRVPLESMRDMQFPLHGAGYLDIGRVEAMLPEAAQLWIAGYLHLYEEDVELADPRIVAARVSLPSDRAFADYTSAEAHVLGSPLPEATDLAWQQAMMDVVLDYAIGSDQSRFSINPMLARLGVRTSTVLRFLPPGGSERAFQYIGDPGLVRLDPRWHQAARRFVELGFSHILDGIDHLLFILCLVIPFRRIRPLIAIVTSFTVAHSITLIASAVGFAPTALWFPPLIEVLIAISIVYMAFENIVGARLQTRWLLAFAFGLVHGFGFSFALRESLQFAGSHLATSLLGFNLGVELGQIFVLVLAIPVLNALFRFVVAERMGTILLSALVAHTAWHWMLERGAVLREYQFDWPAFDLALAASATRGLMLLLVLAGAVWAMYGLYTRLTGAGPGAPAARPVSSSGSEP